MKNKLILLIFSGLLYSCNPISNYYYINEIPTPPKYSSIPIIKNPNSLLKSKEVIVPYEKLEIGIGDFYVDKKLQRKNILATVILSDNSIENDVDWFISDNSIAKISNYGVITGLKEGTVIVTAVSKRDYSKRAKFLLTVYSNNFEPKKSPTKDQIAFISNKDSKNNLYLMNTDGTNQIKIAEDIFIDNNKKDNFSWSPDGTKIFYTTNANTYHILNIDTNINTRLNIESYPFNITWSPDSSKLAFRTITKNDPQQSEVFIINNDGSNLVKLRDKKFKFDSFYWSPDSKKLLHYFGYNAVSVYNLDNQNDIFITEAKDFCWHPDSSKILFVPVIKGNDFFYEDTSSPIFQIDIEGNNKKEFSKNMGLTYSKFSLSPDKKQITVIGIGKDKEFNVFKSDIYIFSDNGDLIKKITNNTLLSFDKQYPDLQNGGVKKDYLSKYIYNNAVWINNKNLLVDIRENVSDKYGYGYNKTFIVSLETGNMLEVDLDNKKTFSNIYDTKIFFSELNNGQNKDISNEIYSLDINSSQITRITNNNYINSQKRIIDIKDIEITRNPDNDFIDISKLKGRFIISVINTNPFINNSLFIKKINNELKEIYSESLIVESISISNNGKMVAFLSKEISNNPKNYINIINLDDSKKTLKIQLSSNSDISIVWTSNDEYILFTDDNLNIIKNDGTGLKTILNTQNKSNKFNNLLSINNNIIIIHENSNGSNSHIVTNVYKMNIDGTDKKLILTRSDYLSILSYSQDSDKFVYSYKGNIYTMNSDGSNISQITFTSKNNKTSYSFPYFSPDNKKILCLKNLSFNQNINVKPNNISSIITIMDIDGKNEKELTFIEDFASKAVWSEDGKYIYYSALEFPVAIPKDLPTPFGLEKIYVMTSEGKNKTPIIDRSINIRDFKYSRN